MNNGRGRLTDQSQGSTRSWWPDAAAPPPPPPPPGFTRTKQKMPSEIKPNTLNRWSRNPKFIPTISEPILLSFL